MNTQRRAYIKIMLVCTNFVDPENADTSPPINQLLLSRDAYNEHIDD